MNTEQKYGLAEIFQNGMLFQREKEIVLWGNAEPGITVTATFYKEGVSKPFLHGKNEADRNGLFLITLPPQKAGEGYRLCITFESADTEPILLKNIGFGDIWLAGGQSNMEFFLKYDCDWEATKKLPRNPKIRMYNVPQRAFEGHTTHNKMGYGYWFDDTDPGLTCFSAPAYSFARNIQSAIKIPIGIIGCNWGGSSASAWVPEEALRTPPLDRYLKEYEEAVSGIPPEKVASESLSAWAFEDSEQHSADFEPLLYGRDRDWQLQYIQAHADDPAVPMGPYNFNRPCGLYYTMLSGLIPFSIKGVLWYQGESDAGDHAFMYDKLLTALIENWRKEWNDTFPFLIVQLAPFGKWLDYDNRDYAIVREKQAFVSRNLTNVFMVSIMDLGSYYDIHPKEKMEVGRRLALLARGHVYREKDLLCDAPEAVKAVFLKDRQIVITFRHGDGLTLNNEKTDWKIHMQNQDIQPEKVIIKENLAVLTLPDSVSEDQIPLFVSLGWDDYAEIHLYNRAGLSAKPFMIKITRGGIS